MVLTVIFRDDSPMLYANDSPTYRSVQVELTPEQVQRLVPRHTHTCGETHYHEAISKCFIEPAAMKEEGK